MVCGLASLTGSPRLGGAAGDGAGFAIGLAAPRGFHVLSSALGVDQPGGYPGGGGDDEEACATTAALRSGWPVRSSPARFSPVALIRAAVGGVALVLLLRIAEAEVQPAQVILNGSHPGNIFIGGARVPIA